MSYPIALNLYNNAIHEYSVMRLFNILLEINKEIIPVFYSHYTKVYDHSIIIVTPSFLQNRFSMSYTYALWLYYMYGIEMPGEDYSKDLIEIGRIYDNMIEMTGKKPYILFVGYIPIPYTDIITVLKRYDISPLRCFFVSNEYDKHDLEILYKIIEKIEKEIKKTKN